MGELRIQRERISLTSDDLQGDIYIAVVAAQVSQCLSRDLVVCSHAIARKFAPPKNLLSPKP